MIVFINSGSWFAQSSMSLQISFRSSFCSSVSSLGTNFADTLRIRKSSVRMEWTEPVLIPTSTAISLTATRRSFSTSSRTWSFTSSFRLVHGLPERGSLSTDFWPFLRRLNHSFVWVGLKATSPNTCWIFRIVSIWVSPSFLTKLDAIPLSDLFHHNNKIFLKIQNRQACIMRPQKTLYRKRMACAIGLKLFTIAHECMCVRPRFARVIWLNAVWQREKVGYFGTDLVHVASFLKSFRGWNSAKWNSYCASIWSSPSHDFHGLRALVN